MAVVNTGMSKADMKKIFLRAKEEPVSCAVGQGENSAVGLLMMRHNKSPKVVEAELKAEFPGVKNQRFGTAFISADENPKLVKFQLNRPVSGMARRLVKTLKGTGYNKVLILGDDGSVFEDCEEVDEEAEADEAQAAPAAPAAAPPPPPPPGAPPPPPAAGKTPQDAAALVKLLASLAPRIPAAAGADADRKAALMKLATDANVNIKTGNLVYAANFLEQLRRALDAAPAAPAAEPAAPTSTTAEPATLQTLTASRREWEGVQTTVKAEVDKLRDALAKTYEGQPFASEINAKFTAKVAPVTAQFDDRLLDVLDDLMNTSGADERAALIAQARGLIKTYLSFAMTDPFITELDANPFVKLSIRPTVTTTLANLAKTMH